MTKALLIHLISNEDDTREVFLNLDNDIECQCQWSDNLAENFETIPEEVNALVVELPGGEEPLNLLKKWAAENSDVPVYVITGSSDLNDVRLYMRSGARDVFVKPLKADEILKEMKQVQAEQDAVKEGAKLISFMNVKGGNGCTTIAVNTALEIAKAKGSLKVLLIDLDIQFGDAASMMNLGSPNTVLEAISQADRLDASLLASLVTETDYGLHVLASPDRLMALDAVRPGDVKKLMEVALEVYEVVIVDLPHVITAWVNEVLRWSDHLFLVAQGSVSDVRDGNLILSHLATIGANSEAIYFLHNRSGVKNAAVDSEQLTKSFKTDRLVQVRNDYEAAIQASNLGRAVSDYAKNSRLAKDVQALAKLIVEKNGHKFEKETGIFNRFFKKHGE